MIYDFFRWLGVLTGYPFKWLILKNKIYYETSFDVVCTDNTTYNDLFEKIKVLKK